MIFGKDVHMSNLGEQLTETATAYLTQDPEAPWEYIYANYVASLRQVLVPIIDKQLSPYESADTLRKALEHMLSPQHARDLVSDVMNRKAERHWKAMQRKADRR
jgi:hypothetical protein